MRLKKLLLILLLLAGCQSSPPDTRHEYLMSGAGSKEENFAWINLAKCSQAPATLSDVKLFCDLSTIRVILVSVDVLMKYHAGDQYP